MKVFVTGASGLVGFRLVQLLLDCNYTVVGLVRATSNTDNLLELEQAHKGRLCLETADLADQNKLINGMQGCDVVVHTAASIQAIGGGKDLYDINVEGTRSTLKAAIASNIKQFIHISSLSVITGEEDCYGVTESQSFNYCREPYANSKIEAEKLVMDEKNLGQIAVTALRPGFIYGPNERTWMPRLVRAIKSGTAMLVDDGSKETNVIYVGNLCRAIQLALLNPVTYGQVYNLTDGQVVTKKELFNTMCDALNVPRVKIAIPKFAALWLVDMVTFIEPLAPKSLKPFLSLYSRAAYRLVAINQGFDISKAERELNYIDRIPFAEAMAMTMADWGQPLAKQKKSSHSINHSPAKSCYTK